MHLTYIFLFEISFILFSFLILQDQSYLNLDTHLKRYSAHATFSKEYFPNCLTEGRCMFDLLKVDTVAKLLYYRYKKSKQNRGENKQRTHGMCLTIEELLMQRKLNKHHH